MSTNNPKGKSDTSKDGEDLTTILDATQRGELTLLIANITESMRKILVDTFDPEIGLDQSAFPEDLTEDQKLMATDLSSVDVDHFDEQRRLKEEREKDVNSLKMKNLKKSSLQAFDTWRDQVITRVGEVVNSKQTAQKQVQETSADQPKPNAPTIVGKIIEAPEAGTKLRFKDLYQPTPTPLTKLPMDRRTLILHSTLLLILSLEHYSAPSRVLLLLLTSSLKLPLKTFEQDEHATAKGLLEGAKHMTADQETKKKAEENKDSRKWKVGLATAAGAALIGVTGGLAAPLVAAGIGSVMGGLGLGATTAATYLGTVAGSTYLVGGLFGAYGGRMTGQMMDKYAREVEDFEFLPVHTNKKTSEDQVKGAQEASQHDHKLRVTLCISGWLTEKEEIVKPWRVLGTTAEVFALKYELEALLNLGNAISGMVQSAAWGYAKKQIIAQTIFADLALAMWPIGLMKVARVIDNPFNIAKSRSEKAGEVLADALINKAQGERPVTLIGYSLGARVIYTCLKSLAKRKAFGLIENAVFIGAPTPSDTSDWRELRTVVSGRLVNVYSQEDYILGFMYRTSSLQYGVAGLQPIQGLNGVENVDVSEDVKGHLRYRYLIGSILKKIGFEDINMQAVEEEKDALRKMEEEEQKNSIQAQRKRLVRRESHGGKEDEDAEAEEEAAELEKDIQAKTQKSLVTRAIQYFYTPTSSNGDEPRQAAQGTSQATTTTGKTVGDAKGTTQNPAGNSPPRQADSSGQVPQSYTSKAAGYLPSMPKQLPSLPSMAGWGQSQSKSETAKAVEEPSNSGKNDARQAVSAADKLVRPKVKNITDPQINTATSAVEGIEKSVPMTSKEQSASQSTTSKNIPQTSETNPTVGQGATYKTTGLNTSVGDRGSKTDASKAQKTQSYATYAASYLPSVPKSLPGWAGGRSRPPKLEKRGSSDVRSPPPKLKHRSSSGLKSPPPRLASTKASSATKETPRSSDLDRKISNE